MNKKFKVTFRGTDVVEFEEGTTYKEIADYMENKEINSESKIKIERLHRNNQHKFVIPTYRKDEEYE